MDKGKVLKTTISLLGKIDPSLAKALDKAQKKSRDTGKGMATNMKNAGSAMTKSIKGFAKGAIAVFASIRAAAKLKEFAKECISEAKAAIDVETKLATVLKNVTSIQIRGPNAAAKAANNLIKVADQMEQSGVVAGDVMVAGFQQLATFQLDDKVISTLSGGMADLLAQQKGLDASQKDAVSVANMIGKVMTGSTSALSRIGITFTEEQEKLLKTGDAMQRAATLSEVLQQNVGGVNKALAQTDQGKLLMAENAIGAIKDEIGRKLLPIIANVVSKAVPLVSKALDKVAQVLDKVLPNVERLADKAAPIMEEAFDKLGVVISRIGPYVDQLFSFIFDAADKLAPILGGLGQQLLVSFGGMLPDILALLSNVFGAVQQIAPTVMGIISVIVPAIAPIVSSLISIAQMLLPKIVSLIQSLGPLFQALSPILQFAGKLIGNVFQKAGVIIGGFLGVVQSVINVLTNLINYVTSAFSGGGVWSTAWASARSVFSNVWNSMKNIARTALAAIVSPINAIIGGINKVSGAVGIPAIPNIEVPQFAVGATVTRPTLAVVGEGSDPETIVPHNNKPRSRRLLARAAAGVGTPIGKGNSYTYAPTIYANNTQGVKEALYEDFERFKQYLDQILGNDDREVFA